MEAGEIKAILSFGLGFLQDAVQGDSWFSQGVVKPGKAPHPFIQSRSARRGHQWAYLPDVAEMMVRLAERGEWPDLPTFPMEGH